MFSFRKKQSTNPLRRISEEEIKQLTREQALDLPRIEYDRWVELHYSKEKNKRETENMIQNSFKRDAESRLRDTQFHLLNAKTPSHPVDISKTESGLRERLKKLKEGGKSRKRKSRKLRKTKKHRK